MRVLSRTYLHATTAANISIKPKQEQRAIAVSKAIL